MPTPEQLRADAELLRGVARTIRTKAAALDDDVVAVQSHYPQKSGGVWEGPAADHFYGELGKVKSNLGKVKTDVEGYAGRCDTKAGQLEREADTLEREQRSKD
jgi:hypothetical protein